MGVLVVLLFLWGHVFRLSALDAFLHYQSHVPVQYFDYPEEIHCSPTGLRVRIRNDSFQGMAIRLSIVDNSGVPRDLRSLHNCTFRTIPETNGSLLFLTPYNGCFVHEVNNTVSMELRIDGIDESKRIIVIERIPVNCSRSSQIVPVTSLATPVFGKPTMIVTPSVVTRVVKPANVTTHSGAVTPIVVKRSSDAPPVVTKPAIITTPVVKPSRVTTPSAVTPMVVKPANVTTLVITPAVKPASVATPLVVRPAGGTTAGMATPHMKPTDATRPGAVPPVKPFNVTTPAGVTPVVVEPVTAITPGVLTPPDVKPVNVTTPGVVTPLLKPTNVTAPGVTPVVVKPANGTTPRGIVTPVEKPANVATPGAVTPMVVKPPRATAPGEVTPAVKPPHVTTPASVTPVVVRPAGVTTPGGVVTPLVKPAKVTTVGVATPILRPTNATTPQIITPVAVKPANVTTPGVVTPIAKPANVTTAGVTPMVMKPTNVPALRVSTPVVMKPAHATTRSVTPDVKPADVATPGVVTPMVVKPADVTTPRGVTSVVRPADLTTPRVITPMDMKPANTTTPGVITPVVKPASITTPRVTTPDVMKPADVATRGVVTPMVVKPATVTTPRSVTPAVKPTNIATPGVAPGVKPTNVTAPRVITPVVMKPANATTPGVVTPVLKPTNVTTPGVTPMVVKPADVTTPTSVTPMVVKPTDIATPRVITHVVVKPANATTPGVITSVVKPASGTPPGQRMNGGKPVICAVDAKDRLPCSDIPLGEKACDAKGCCYDPNDEATACFYGKTAYIDCANEGLFTIVVPKVATVPSLDLASVVLVNGTSSECAPVMRTTEFVIFSFPLNACGSVKTVTGSIVTYQVDVVARRRIQKGARGSITRDSTFRLHVKCYLSSSENVPITLRVNTLSPPSLVIYDGVLYLEMRIAKDLSYTTWFADEDYPLVSYLREPVYVEVRLLHRQDANIALVLNHCWATQTQDRHLGKQWSILVNGCPYYGDNYLTQLHSVVATPEVLFPAHHKWFEVKTFQFVDGNTRGLLSGEVYLHCSATVCPLSDVECVSTCPTGKRTVRSSGDFVSIEARDQRLVTLKKSIIFSPEEKTAAVSYQANENVAANILLAAAVISLALALITGLVLCWNCKQMHKS